MSVKVKICGLTNLTDAQVALEAGADFLGFIFHPESPRYVTTAQVAELLAELNLPAHVHSVGVFVNTPSEEVIKILDETGLHLAQLHGDEPESALAALNGRAFKVIRPKNAAAAEQVNVYTPYPKPPAPQLMLEAYDPKAYGGTGQRADWQLASSIAQVTPCFMLAGGLTAANVQEAIATVAPWAVDVASGVEAAKGRKDHTLVRAFIANAQAAP